MTVHEQYEPIERPHIESGEIFENDPVRDKKLPRRRLARERVMQMLYSHEISGGDIDSLFYTMVQKELLDDEQALQFARELTLRLTSHKEEINTLIGDKLRHWDLRRVALIDRMLIQMGITELMYFPEIPPKATINELIEIAKDFSTDESGKFINGILHAVMTHLKESGTLNKSGRGLIDRALDGKDRADIKAAADKPAAAPLGDSSEPDTDIDLDDETGEW